MRPRVRRHGLETSREIAPGLKLERIEIGAAIVGRSRHEGNHRIRLEGCFAAQQTASSRPDIRSRYDIAASKRMLEGNVPLARKGQLEIGRVTISRQCSADRRRCAGTAASELP